MKNARQNEAPERTTVPEGKRDAELAALLRTAGPRPLPPAEDKEIVKAAALAQWQWTVRLERRRKRFRQGAMVLAAAAALAFVAFQPVVRSVLGFGAAESLGTVELAWGRVLAGSGPEATALVAGSELLAGGVVETEAEMEPASRAVLQLAGGSTLRLDAGSRLRLLGGQNLALDRGALYVDSGPDGAAVEIHTPFGEVRDIGTRFEVRLEDEGALRVRVRDGEVELRHGSETHRAGAGEEMVQQAGGSLRRSRIEAYSPVWAWVGEALPPFRIEGRTLDEFLTWASHEGGWELRYSTPELRSEASRAQLFGSVEGLTLDQALSAMLAGSALTFQLERGVLLVDRAP
ncbi:MAG: FecR domain-containing protein [Acidobacteria bacterium]|nr:FecR domain-containing protein [Acidobacteriota bacterium]